MSVTIYSCFGDSTGAYCRGDATASGAPLEYGMAACGPSWPFGTVFRFVETGQEVVCWDRGGAVHDAHLDVWCEYASQRAACLPGIGATAEVEVVGGGGVPARLPATGIGAEVEAMVP